MKKINTIIFKFNLQKYLRENKANIKKHTNLNVKKNRLTFKWQLFMPALSLKNTENCLNVIKEKRWRISLGIVME